MKSVYFHTLGCKLNQAETSMLAEGFTSRGYAVASSIEEAAVVFVNTCTVTGRTDYRSRQAIRRFIKSAPNAFIIVGGCYAELQAAALARIKGVDLILGSDSKFDVFEHLNGLEKRDDPLIIVEKNSKKFRAPETGDFGVKTRAFLKIQDGCDSFCSYCAVPYARGTSRSAAPDDVLRRAGELISRGYREIVLTGVHIGKYGIDLSPETSLAELLDILHGAAPGTRIRLSSLEPHEISDRLLDSIERSPRICRHFHIPLQSGSDTVLRRMNRKYTIDEYITNVHRIRRQFPGAGLGTDVIVGFPGETERDFELTHEVVRTLPFSYFHVFRYSRRSSTAAALMEDDVSPQRKSSRSATLRMLGRQKARHFAESFIGERAEVLFEKQEPGGSATGLTSNYIRVEITSTEPLTNSMRTVELIDVLENGNVQCRLVE